MREHEVNSLDNFIMGWYSDDTTFCDALIKLFNDSKDKHNGVIGTDNTVDNSIKESIDLHFEPDQFNSMYYGDLIKKISFKYIERYDRAKGNGMFPVEGFNIQYYPVGGGFKQWHCERESADVPSTSRHLVFMTYLNDVEDGGTDFMHQNLTVKAEKGLTIMWPSDWTHTHKGQISHTEEKFIATGWLHHIETASKEQNENRRMLGRPS